MPRYFPLSPPAHPSARDDAQPYECCVPASYCHCAGLFMLRLYLPSLSLHLILAHAALKVTVSEHAMGAPLSRARPWTVRVSGWCGADCKTLRRIHSASCRDRLFVAWTAHAGWTPNLQYPEQDLQDEVSEGHIAEFRIDANGTAALVSDQELAWCNEMGAVSVTPDCAIVGALCRSSLEPSAAGAYDWVSATDPERAQFGWWQTSIPDVADPKYRLVDQMYLLEWTQGTPGQTALAPTSKVCVQSSARHEMCMRCA